MLWNYGFPASAFLLSPLISGWSRGWRGKPPQWAFPVLPRPLVFAAAPSEAVLLLHPDGET